MRGVNESPGRRLVPALARGLALLEALAGAEAPLTGADLARSTELPRTTVHDLLHTLAALGYVRETGRGYAVAPKVLGLGHGYLAAVDLAGEADRAVRRLGDLTGETVQVAILDGTDVLYIAKADSRNALRLVSAVGRRLPAHLTGVGKALLAQLDEAELDRRYPAPELPTMTPHSIGRTDELKRALAEVRAAGLAYDSCESNPDVACVAAPVRDHLGACVAALSCSVPITRWTDAYAERLSGLVRQAAAELSTALGAAAPGP
ncbi:MAG TPA: IclR family transcriptional regulator [Microlunatus sp.]|nr:IclR family transcriptional regulator [Microlunatus sp.]